MLTPNLSKMASKHLLLLLVKLNEKSYKVIIWNFWGLLHYMSWWFWILRRHKLPCFDRLHRHWAIKIQSNLPNLITPHPDHTQSTRDHQVTAKICAVTFNSIQSDPTFLNLTSTTPNPTAPNPTHPHPPDPHWTTNVEQNSQPNFHGHIPYQLPPLIKPHSKSS